MRKEPKPEDTEVPAESLSTGDRIRASMEEPDPGTTDENIDMSLSNDDDSAPEAKDSPADKETEVKEPDPATTDEQTIVSTKEDETPGEVAKVTDPELKNPMLAHIDPVKTNAQPDQNNLLLQQVAQLQAQIAQLQAAPKDTPSQQKAQSPGFNFDVQEQLVNAIQSEDPNVARQGIGYMAQAIAKSTYDQVLNQVRTEMQVAQQAMPAQISEAAERDRINKDYYGNFPTHENFRDLVKAEATKLSTLYPNNKFDVNFRNALGHIVNEKIRLLAGVPNTPVVPTAAPSHTTNNRRVASSSGADNSRLSITNDIMSLM